VMYPPQVEITIKTPKTRRTAWLRPATIRTNSPQRKMNRLRSEARLASCRRHQLRGFRHIQIDQLSTVITNRVVVTLHNAVVTAGTVAKTNLVNEPGIFQVAQRVVDGCVADPGQALAGSLKNVAGGRVIVTFADHLEDCLALWC